MSLGSRLWLFGFDEAFFGSYKTKSSLWIYVLPLTKSCIISSFFCIWYFLKCPVLIFGSSNFQNLDMFKPTCKQNIKD
jgi:hypothetical protein